jgi:hypothetical protein
MKILNARRVRAAFVLLLIAYGPVLGAQTTSKGTPAVNPDSALIMDFEKQIKDYMKLRKRAESVIPALKSTASAHKINEHRRLLASNIQAARPQAKQGDIFSPEITQEFKHLISLGYQGADAAKVRTSLRNDEPVNGVPVRVNAVYPEHIPLQTMPPSILLNLPDLPHELDYRIVGRMLVLRDVGANLIVDYIPGAIPSS